MLRKAASLTLAALFALTLCACNSGGSGQSSTSSQASGSDTSASQAAEYDPMVESIDLTLDGGNIRFNRVEKANAELTDSENALVFVFDYTNTQSKPAQVLSTFRVQFFQNGVELRDNASYSSAGGEQYELVDAFFNEAMKDGTVTFGQIVVPKDESPITIMVSPNGAALEDNYQTMEVALDKLNANAESPSE